MTFLSTFFKTLLVHKIKEVKIQYFFKYLTYDYTWENGNLAHQSLQHKTKFDL